MTILELPRYHNYCGERLGKRNVRISAGGYDNPNYPVDFCSKCEVYMYYHGKNHGKNGEGIESRNPHDMESYISNLILEGKKALAPAAPRIF